MPRKITWLITILILFTAITWPSPTPTLAAAKKPTFKITYLTSTVYRGKKARVVIKTQPAAKCMLKYKLPSGKTSKAKGLGKVIADKNGNCSWTWTISTNTKPGLGSLIITVDKYTERHPILIR